MQISRELAIEILKYCYKHKYFYFPFSVVCKEHSPKNDVFMEVEPNEWRIISNNKNYKTFELQENLQDLYYEAIKLMSKGFIEKITNNSLEQHIKQLAMNYRNEWKEELWESEKIEEFGFNEFMGGKAEAYEDCLYLIKKYKGIELLN
jgi:hypothetical protein